MAFKRFRLILYLRNFGKHMPNYKVSTPKNQSIKIISFSHVTLMYVKDA
jgi:hypothetical protein